MLPECPREREVAALVDEMRSKDDQAYVSPNGVAPSLGEDAIAPDFPLDVLPLDSRQRRLRIYDRNGPGPRAQ